MNLKSLLITFTLFVCGQAVATDDTVHSIDTTEFNVTIYGEGQPILLIPGLSSSASVWDDTVAALKHDYQLHVLQLAGFAGKPALPAELLQQGFVSTQTTAIYQYILANDLVDPVLVGHSLGGFIAMKLALAHPDHIAGVVNVDSLPALGALFGSFEDGSSEQGTAENAPAAFDPYAMAASMSNNSAWHERIVADMFRSDGMTSGQVMGELMMADLRDDLANLRVPMLTLGALQNGAPYAQPEQVQQNYETQFASVPPHFHTLAYAEDTRHFIMADAPEWLVSMIQSFMAEL